MLIGFFVFMTVITAAGVAMTEKVDRPKRRAARTAAEQAVDHAAGHAAGQA